jgi:hypothetical protein
MMRSLSSLGLGAILTLSFLGAPSPGQDAGKLEALPRPTSEDDLKKLIADLDSPKFNVRDEATRRLKVLGKAALPALQEVQNSKPSLEVASRVEDIIGETERRLADQAILEMVAKVNEMGIDKFVDLMVDKRVEKAEVWQLLDKLVQAMADRGAKIGGKGAPSPCREFGKFPLAAAPDGNCNSGTRYLVKGLKHINSTDGCVIVSSGTVEHLNSTTNSILFVHGDIKRLNYTDHCIIFCTGSIEGWNCTTNNFIVCAGSYKDCNHNTGNIIHAGKVEKPNYSKGNVYLGVEKIQATHSEQDACIPTDKGPLQLFKMSKAAK